MELHELYVDYYLDQIAESEENLNEFEPISVGAGIALATGTIYTIGMVVSYLVSVAAYTSTVKVDAKLTKRMNDIMKSGSTWKVHVFPDPVPNAFAIGGKHIFITTGLTKMLTAREQEAVLLHEIYHNKDMHVYKHLMAESAFAYLAIFVALTASLSVALPIAGLIFFIMRGSMRILYARFRGRYFETKSDEYAVKMGYGPDLVSALGKLEKWVTEQRSKTVCKSICQLERKISEEIDEHPPVQKRIETILRKEKELARAMNGGYKAIEQFVTGVFKNNG